VPQPASPSEKPLIIPGNASEGSGAGERTSRLERWYEFGPFRLDTWEHALLRGGHVVSLEPKVFDLLKVMVQKNGRLIQKDELLKEVWPDSFVEEGNLNRNISILRKVLDDDSSGKSYIETVPKRGYRFVAEVKAIAGDGSRTIVTEPPDQNTRVTDAGPLPSREDADFGSRKALFMGRWLVLGGVVLLAVGTVVFVLMRRGETDPPLPRIQSIAVLPLQNLSGDPAQEYFADGMTETLISSLAQLRALRVISRTSVMSFKHAKEPLPPLPEIARALKVDAVIEGSVQREHGRVKVLVQLIHGPTDTHLWARDYERALTDVLKLQGEIARAIADEIRIQLTPEEKTRISSAASINPSAYQEYLLGRYHFWKHIIQEHRRAIDHFERAIQIDPSYAAAYAGLSLAWQKWATQSGATLKEYEPQARAAVRKALELDGRLPEAYVAQGHLQSFHDWDWKGGENSIKRALDLDPNSLDVHYNYAFLLNALGRFQDALTEIQTAEQLDPLSHQVQSLFGSILCVAGQPDEAVRRFQQAIDREPRSANAHTGLALCYVELAKYAEAIETFDKARVLRGKPPDNPRFRALLANVYARMGKRSEAKRLLTPPPDGGYEPTSPAAAYAALGDHDTAFKILFRQVDERSDANVPFIKTNPGYAGLHSDPRWRELMQRMNLPAD
jgi:TolB-like protein/DNA-binding winged helix-turn-helix (wHTH) protein/Tfp pilus assembly protein PilF